MSTFSFRAGFFKKARKVWHCLAFHLIADGNARTMKFTWSIPWLFSMELVTPLIPRWLGADALTGGSGERAEYGLWHDYHEFKLQWRRIIDLSGKRAGLEYRRIHWHSETSITKKDHLISNVVYDDPYTALWVKENEVDRWAFEVSTWYVSSHCWWIPDLYDFVFTLKAQKKDQRMQEVWVKRNISPRLMPIQVFQTLTKKIKFD